MGVRGSHQASTPLPEQKTRTIALSQRRRTRECGRAIYYYSAAKSYIGSYRTLFLFPYPPLSFHPPLGYPLFGSPLAHWSIPYSIPAKTRTVTYRSMAVEIICRFLLTFRGTYIICLYQLCYDSSAAPSASRSTTAETSLLIHHLLLLQDGGWERRYWIPRAPSKGGPHEHSFTRPQKNKKTKWTGRSTYILRPQPGIYIALERKSHAKDKKGDE